MYSRDILKFINFIYHEYIVKMQDVSSNLYVLYYFDEVLTSRKPNIMTFSITGTKILFVDFIIST